MIQPIAMTQLKKTGGSDIADSSFAEGCTSPPIDSRNTTLTKAQQIYLRHAMHEIWHLTRYAIAFYSRLQELSKAMLTSTAEEQFYLVRLINSQQSDYQHSFMQAQSARASVLTTLATFRSISNQCNVS